MISSFVTSLGTLLSQGLTPYEKYEAVRRLGAGGQPGNSILTDRWFVLLAASIVFILTIVLLVVRRVRIEHEKAQAMTKFNHEANRKGLTAEEREILLGIAKKAGLKRINTIFNHWPAFDKGSAKLMQEVFSAGQSIVQRKKLNMTVNSVKVKLGFGKPVRSHGVGGGVAKGPNSRSIPEGRQVSIAPTHRTGGSRIDAVVVKNTEYELLLRPEIPVLSVPGDMWNVQYRFGSAVWEFDALTLVCGIDGLELNHTDSVRYVNRRRFRRAAVDKPALIAKFPVIRKEAAAGLKKPDFIECRITEISGPGLRVSTQLEAGYGDRVLIIFELENGRLVEDIAEVRGSRDTAVGRSIAVELIGLNEAGLNELVRFSSLSAAEDADSRQAEEEEPEPLHTASTAATENAT